MIADITSMENMIRGYIVSTMTEHYPELDTSENSVFDDLFIKTMVHVMAPFIEKVNRLEIKSDLSNAEFMSDEEMDSIGEGNYFISRDEGSRAAAVVTLTFSNLDISNPELIIRIPPGTTFATSSGLEFQTEQDTRLTPEDLGKLYNRQKMRYELDIVVYAIEVGSEYNVGAGEITECKTPFSSYFTGAINKSDVASGKGRESNTAYAERIRNQFIYRDLGTIDGYKSHIRRSFTEITDLYVAGYKDPYMQRDKLLIYDEENQEIRAKHVGGMVDIYVKGSVYDPVDAQVYVNSNFLVINTTLENLVTKTDEDGNEVYDIEVVNMTDKSKNPRILSVEQIPDDFMGGEYKEKVKVVLDNENNLSFDPDAVNSIMLSYKKIIPEEKEDEDENTDGEASIESVLDIKEEEAYFTVGITKTELATPLISLGGLFLPDKTEIPGMDEKIILDRIGDLGTTDEVVFATFAGFDDYPNGCEITLKYTINETLRGMSLLLNDEGSRLITADVSVKEAEAIPVNLQMTLKISNKYRLSDTDSIISKIKTSVISFFDSYMLGDNVEESDVVGWLYTDTSIKDAIQYVSLPLDVFYIPGNINEEIPNDGTQVSPTGFLDIEAIQYPVLNMPKFKINIIP